MVEWCRGGHWEQLSQLLSLPAVDQNGQAEALATWAGIGRATVDRVWPSPKKAPSKEDGSRTHVLLLGSLGKFDM